MYWKCLKTHKAIRKIKELSLCDSCPWERVNKRAPPTHPDISAILRIIDPYLSLRDKEGETANFSTY
jgi:hypothetical protein